MKKFIDDPEILSREWDVIVIGTGVGGATAGYALAKAGKSVLFCERGRYHVDSPDSLAGDWLEALTGSGSGGLTAEQKRRGGRFTGSINDVTGPHTRQIWPVLGIGTGGSSALYGMVMERLFPSDFTPASHYRDAEDANLPTSWPISFNELNEYYSKAEGLYGVRATVDPLRPPGETRSIRVPPAFTASVEELAENFRSKGLHPYHVPVACEYLPGCRECVGYICPQRCKRDSVTACLEPALEQHGAALLSECEVDTLDSADGRVTAVNARWRGKQIRLSGRKVILAAGAVHTPAILLRSNGAGGLANGSGQVGRNLMRHFVDYYIVYTKTRYTRGPQKQIAMNDFYLIDGMKLGTIQSNGRMPPARSIAAGFKETLQEVWRPLGLLYPVIRAIVEFRVQRMLSGGHALVSFMEDLPYQSNRIGLSEDKQNITLEYSIGPFEARRLAQFRLHIANALKPLKFKKIYRASENRVLGHVCGTCRFGMDPQTSVLNRDNRAHEIENLYVVDASFFPTSGGINPSLTIAANALRVADRIVALDDGTASRIAGNSPNIAEARKHS
ncbi:glucose-methanol-choline oxidoreductase [Mesorhizobium sp. LSJC255A00]|uniref:GMC oxidoreductase n=1 Tax=unclassified Mesorhizobium TaxID=325217 RepID=UPI0003CE4432|nr:MULTISPECIES: GMC family oxidoreductase [unclassified Mesorhizobium]ESX20143.1 glucose-methanol-choline oxidoreductase [Mesorhizobium sp. LSJC255A00]ESX78096.1 glucose-methanol-choline oxidoreductase [Mesorhizobium sp. LSHC414A00]